MYQVASITKPVTATALMMLVERGQIVLGDSASRYLPEFKGEDREKVRVIDLLTHTSGLPDMVPRNTELRRAHAPLKEFTRETFTTPLLFPPRTDFRYSSMGTLLAAEIVERVSHLPLPEFEAKRIFGPLGMKNTILGLGKMRVDETVEMEMPRETDPQDLKHWGPNTLYWRMMAHPWGGMHTTTSDLAVFLQAFLNGGSYAGTRILSRGAVTAMTSDQNGRHGTPWGIGWALARSRDWNSFGDLVSARTFGHSGASGTVAWADPESGTICVILTSRNFLIDGGRLLRRISNAVAASVTE